MRRKIERLERIERLRKRLHELSAWRLAVVTQEREKLATAHAEMVEALGDGLMAYGPASAAGDAARARHRARDGGGGRHREGSGETGARRWPAGQARRSLSRGGARGMAGRSGSAQPRGADRGDCRRRPSLAQAVDAKLPAHNRKPRVPVMSESWL